MKRCNPEAAIFCDNLAAVTSVREHASAQANRFLASSEMKIFGSFVAITIFLIVAFCTTRYADIGVLNQTVGRPPHPILGGSQALRFLFMFAVFIHHCRIFLGLSYADDRRKVPERQENGREVALERWLRMLCTITFPMFSIFLFDPSRTAVIIVKLVWAIQLTCIVAYDSVFLWRAVRGIRVVIVIASDIVNAVFGGLFFFIAPLDALLARLTHTPPSGNLGTAALILFPLASGILFCLEFCLVYGQRFFDNLGQVWRYLTGRSLDALQT